MFWKKSCWKMFTSTWIFTALFFSKLVFPFDSGRFKFLAIFVKYSLKVLDIFLLSLRVSFGSVKIILLLVLHLSGRKGKTVFQSFLLSVMLYMFRLPQNVFLVDFSIFEQILHFFFFQWTILIQSSQKCIKKLFQNYLSWLISALKHFGTLLCYSCYKTWSI